MSWRAIRIARLDLRVACTLLALLLSPLAPEGALHAQYEDENYGKNKIQYRDFNWQIYHSPHFNVYFYASEEPQLPKVLSYAESAYDELSRSLNFQIKEPVPLIFYATHSAFEQNNVILGFIDEGTGAFASPVRFRMVLPIDDPDSELIKLIRHELTHVFQYHILFQGSLARGLASAPPTWFMEGMASYFGRDESTRDKMFLRDIVVNDDIPSIRSDIEGFMAYRYGHAVFDFIEEKWGHEGVLDFVFETRNTLGSRVERSVKRAFKLEPEEFDLEFRQWARKKFLAQLLETGEPGDFGRVFRARGERFNNGTEEISPASSPSGDLVAAISYYRGKGDVVLFDAHKRTLIRNLTRPFSSRYQYLVAQELSMGRRQGRDLSFSPDGNHLAVFAKRERGRSLAVLDVLHGGVEQVIDMVDIEQQLAPAWSPDGTKIAFSGTKDNQFDIFILDLASRTITNLTHDEVYDGGPTFSPDGKSIVCVSVVGAAGFAKLFRIDLATGQRYQLTTGNTNENDPVYSPDGKRIYFTSDRPTAPGKPAERENIYGLDLATGELRQYTNVVTGAYMPAVLKGETGEERIVFGSFWKGSFGLYETGTSEPVARETIAVPTEQSTPKELPRFEPDIQVSVDKANLERYKSHKFFLEDAASFAGIDTNQTFVGRVLLTFSNQLGDSRIFANISSVSTFSNFDFAYLDLSHRLQWQIEAFDNRSFYLAQDQRSGEIVRDRAAIAVTGAVFSIIYPFNFYDRAELGVGYVHRHYNLQEFGIDSNGNIFPFFLPFTDNFPLLQGALVGDTATYSYYGPISGHRWRIDGSYAPQVSGGSGTLFDTVKVDARQYVPLTLRSNFAFRAFIGVAGGARPTPFYFGGLDTVRGIDLYSQAGDRAFFANAEFRFPLIDLLATPVIGFQGIRANVFLDTGGAWYHGQQHFRYYNSATGRLQDGIASYGGGLTFRFLGLDLNWDVARLWDLKTSGSTRTAVWFGTRF